MADKSTLQKIILTDIDIDRERVIKKEDRLPYWDVVDYTDKLKKLMELIGNNNRSSALYQELINQPNRKDLLPILDKYYGGSIQKLEQHVVRNKNSIMECLSDIINWYIKHGYDVDFEIEEVLDQLKSQDRRDAYRRWLSGPKSKFQSLAELDERYRRLLEDRIKRRRIF